MPGVLRQSVISKFEAFGLKFQVDLISGFLLSNGTDLAVVIDINITDLNNPFDYNDYTEEQNAMMFEYEKLFRFSIDSELEIDIAVEQLSILLEPQEQDVDLVFKSIHSDRSIQAIDPTTPEAYFEQAFISAYGRENLKCVSREMPIIDIYGKTRFVDYYIEREGQNVAIEKNGVRYHHPQIIGKQRYQSQLVKQNSIVSSGCKLYRWSLEAFKFIERFLDELKSFIGPADNLKLAQKISVKRDFELYEFQENSLGKLREARKNNIKAGLVVLPTGTGKTEILVSEVASEIHNNQDARLLILCPSRKIKFQNINTLKDRLLNHKSITISDSICNNVVVQTYAWFSRHYREIDRKYFTYIAVDEAHHAVAPTMRAALRHFDPSFILGLTATDKRLDSRKLEDVFGNYDVDLSLREAIENGYLAPIRAFRIKSNVDLSEVRFNGKDYVTSDLQKNILIPSRDQLIVNVLLKYFSGNQIGKKSGVIFCVSIRHAKSLAERLCLAGFTAKAVCGKDSTAEQYTKEYENGDIQFLTTCSLLTEGWNCPRTSIIVMARPTMSKVLYTQQIGRGTRKFPGKEALYVLDVVDNYGYKDGFSTIPWSIHALLGIQQYVAWGSLVQSQTVPMGNFEEQILVDLFEKERKVEEVDIFTFEEKYPDHISDEQIARELFVSTGTVRSWVKKGKLVPDVRIPFGRSMLNYYNPIRIDDIRKSLNLGKHNQSTIYEDFFNFLEERNYSLSYKLVMILSFLKIVDKHGTCNFDELKDEYKKFYTSRINAGIAVDKSSCPYSNQFLSNDSKLKVSILQNPFEKFERKRFMYHCEDLNELAFAPALWEKINNNNDLNRIKTQYFQDLINYYENLGGINNLEKWKEYWNIETIADFETPDNYIFEFAPAEKDKFTEYLPYYNISAAAGAFNLEENVENLEPDRWVKVLGRNLSKDMFALNIRGHSMEPLISDGALAVFRGGDALFGSRQGKIVLVQSDAINCVDTGWNLVVKRYSSKKNYDEFGNFQHSEIRLESLNPAYEPIIFSEDDQTNLKVLGVYLFSI